MDAKILEQQVGGLRARLTELRQNEARFHKAQGLDEQAEKARADAQNHADAIEAAKKRAASLKQAKAAAVANTATALALTMGAVLAEGEAVFDIDEDGKTSLAWRSPDGRTVPHAGLSGGQRVMFDDALAFALLGNAPGKVLILEAAELDDHRLAMALERISETNPDAQLVVNTCHIPNAIPKGWEVIRVDDREPQNAEMEAAHGNA